MKKLFFLLLLLPFLARAQSPTPGTLTGPIQNSLYKATSDGSYWGYVGHNTYYQYVPNPNGHAGKVLATTDGINLSWVTAGSGLTTYPLTNGYGITSFSFNGGTNNVHVIADTASSTGLVSKGRLATNLTGYQKTLTFSNGLTESGASVVLGGSLTGTTSVGLATNTLIFTDTHNGFGGGAGNVFMYTKVPSGVSAGNYAEVQMLPTAASLFYETLSGGAKQSSLQIGTGLGSSSMVFTDPITNVGPIDAGAYEANYVTESLTSKRYVDSAITAHGGGSTGTNGLNGTTNIGLGGMLDSASTTVDLNGNVLNFIGANTTATFDDTGGSNAISLMGGNGTTYGTMTLNSSTSSFLYYDGTNPTTFGILADKLGVLDYANNTGWRNFGDYSTNIRLCPYCLVQDNTAKQLIDSAFTANTTYFASGFLSGIGTSGSPYALAALQGSSISTALGSDATGDVYYRNSSGYLTRLGIGTTGQVLTVASGLPSWATAGGGGGSPAGSNTQIQYNNSGAFGASSTLTYSSSLLTAQVNGIGTSTITPALLLTNTTTSSPQNSPSWDIQHFTGGTQYDWVMYAKSYFTNYTQLHFGLITNGGALADVFYLDNSTMLTIFPNGLQANGQINTQTIGGAGTAQVGMSVPLELKNYTVSGLPSVPTGSEAYVTDALSPVIGSTVVAGGSAKAKVWYNGANWTVTGI